MELLRNWCNASFSIVIALRCNLIKLLQILIKSSFWVQGLQNRSIHPLVEGEGGLWWLLMSLNVVKICVITKDVKNVLSAVRHKTKNVVNTMLPMRKSIYTILPIWILLFRWGICVYYCSYEPKKISLSTDLFSYFFSFFCSS